MKRFRLNRLDLFMLFNFVFLDLMVLIVYYKGEAEFFLYAVVFIALGAYIWRWLRQYLIPWPILILLQIGLLAHFAGGLVYINGVRLYGHIFFDIRFDKYVHFYNSFAGVIALNYLFNNNRLSKRRLSGFWLVAAVFGIGIMIELIELSAYFALPKTAVGDVFNNFFDLLANIMGGTAAVIGLRLKSYLERKEFIFWVKPGDER